MTPAVAFTPRHAAPAAPVETIPADSLAFTIGTHDDPNQLRGFWVRTDHTSRLEIDGPGLVPGTSLIVRLDQIAALVVLLRNADALNGGAR